jgi:hypothetical protein
MNELSRTKCERMEGVPVNLTCDRHVREGTSRWSREEQRER